MSSELAYPILYAVLAWWFTTGLILLLDGLPRHTFRWSMAAATGVLALSMVVMHASAADASPAGAYTAFLCAIGVWGWLEMSFLMGYITGPRKVACVAGCSGWRHFVHATQAVIYNELATLAGGLVVMAATRGGANRVALGTVGLLWVMRLSAKLNLFLGVPNVGEKLLPAHLQYLTGYFRKRPMNLLFPASVTLSTIGVTLLTRALLAASAPFAVTALALLDTLLVLAVLEHWFMVIPLPSEKMWQWALRRQARRGSWPDEERLAGRPPDELMSVAKR